MNSILLRTVYWITRYLTAGSAIYLVFELKNLGVEDWPVVLILVACAVFTGIADRVEETIKEVR